MITVYYGEVIVFYIIYSLHVCNSKRTARQSRSGAEYLRSASANDRYQYQMLLSCVFMILTNVETYFVLAGVFIDCIR